MITQQCHSDWKISNDSRHFYLLLSKDHLARDFLDAQPTTRIFPVHERWRHVSSFQTGKVRLSGKTRSWMIEWLLRTDSDHVKRQEMHQNGNSIWSYSHSSLNTLCSKSALIISPAVWERQTTARRLARLIRLDNRSAHSCWTSQSIVRLCTRILRKTRIHSNVMFSSR